jgi:hypothetical protein
MAKKSLKKKKKGGLTKYFKYLHVGYVQVCQQMDRGVRPVERKKEYASDVCYAPELLNKFNYLPGYLCPNAFFSTLRNKNFIKLESKNITHVLLI